MIRTLAFYAKYGASVFALVFFLSCNPTNPSEAPDDHGHPHGESDHALEEDHPHPHESSEPANSAATSEDDHATEEDHAHPHESSEPASSAGTSEDEHAPEGDHPHPHESSSAGTHEDEHAHEGGEEKTAQVTVWTDRFELFVEHAFIVANVPVQFITHVSDLETLHPRREGPVTFVLQGPSGERLEHVEKSPARAGIYLPELTFPKSGTWNVSLRIPLEGEEFVVNLTPMEVYASNHDLAHAPVAEAPEGISFLKEQQWKILSRTEPVQSRPLTEQLRLTGTVLPVPGKRALVTPPAEGRLIRSGDSKLPFIGDNVEEGQTLAALQPVVASAVQSLSLELDVKSAEAEGRIREANAALDKADQALKRVRELYDKKAKSAREVEEAEFSRQQAQAALAAAQ